MTDPRRLFESAPLDEGARRLLEAGTRVGPPPGATEELWRALAATLPPGAPPPGGGPVEGGPGPALPPAGSAPLGGAATGSPAAGGTAALTLGTLGKTALIGFSLGLGVSFAGDTVARIAAPPPVVASAPNAARGSPSRPAGVSAATPSPDDVTPPAVAAVPETPREPRSRLDDALAAEARRVGRVRALLRAGDATAALADLRALARDFPAGQLAEERAVLEIEALLALGQRTQAESTARTLLERSPHTPHAARIRRALR